jgi:hypothetical protein
MKVRICPTCGERWWCVKCGFCHRCYPDLEPPAGILLQPRGGSPTLPSQAQQPFLVPDTPEFKHGNVPEIFEVRK